MTDKLGDDPLQDAAINAIAIGVDLVKRIERLSPLDLPKERLALLASLQYLIGRLTSGLEAMVSPTDPVAGGVARSGGTPRTGAGGCRRSARARPSRS